MVKNMMVQYQNTAYVKEDHMLKWAHTDGTWQLWWLPYTQSLQNIKRKIIIYIHHSYHHILYSAKNVKS